MLAPLHYPPIANKIFISTQTCGMSPREAKLLPTMSRTFEDFEFSVHVPTNAFLRELTSVFPDASIGVRSPVLVVPTFQRSAVSLLEYGDKEAVEKDRLLLRFFEWCDRVVEAVKQLQPSAWIDATDPASGLAWRGKPGSCYSDVDGLTRLLRYETIDIGGCRVVAHPKWRFAVYPATLFTTATPNVIIQALSQVNGLPPTSGLPD